MNQRILNVINSTDMNLAYHIQLNINNNILLFKNIGCKANRRIR